MTFPAVSGASGRRTQLWAAALIVAAVGAAYANSFLGVFVLDDYYSITTNPTIRQLSWAALMPPGMGYTVEARPILNLSFALNFAISGTEPWSYHAANLGIHLLAALTLFGLLRGILTTIGFRPAEEVALLTTLLWALHPLQTESITYVVQRTESLMGLFYLGTLYCQFRGITADASRRRGWLSVSVLLCALGMGTKEVMITAPILALLIDRTLFAGSFSQAWRVRRWYYGALGGTWIILAALEAGHLGRGGTIGTAAGITWWQYAFCQARGLIYYLRLGFWPHPLIFDYGSDFVTFGQIWFYGLLDLALVALTFFALGRRSIFGLVGAWFFFILAPTTSVVGGTRQMLAEHRMYLPLLSLIVLFVLGLYHFGGSRWARGIGAGCALLLLGVTIRRNSDYQSDLGLYAENFKRRPTNAHGAYNLAYALREHGRTAEAIAHYQTAIRLQPDFPEALDDLANLLGGQPGREAEALAAFEALVRLKPEFGEIHNNMGVVLVRLPGRQADAIQQFEIALRLRPDYPEAHYNLAFSMAGVPGRVEEALTHYEAAVRLKPDYAEAQNGFGVFLARLPGRQADAIAQLERAVRTKPDYAEAHNNLGLLLVRQPGRATEALEHFDTALRLKQDFFEAHFNMGMTLRQLGRPQDAAAHFAAALKIKPDFTAAQNELERLQPKEK